MANTIRIKRSVSTNTPVSLAQGELAYSEDGTPNGEGELFIGTAGPSVTKLTTTVLTGTDGAAAQPNSSAQDNQTITTGTGLSGADGGSSGNVTVSVDYLGTDNIINSATDLEGTAISVSDTIFYHDATDENVKKGLVSDLPFGVGSGDISRVNITAGTGLTGSQDTLTGDHTQTLSFDFSSLTDMTGGISGTTEFILQDGTTESRKAANEIALSNFNNDSGWTSNAGTVTSVTGGTGIDSTGGATPSLSLNFSELTDMTATITGSTEFILQDGVTESRKTANEIVLSAFNNDEGWEANDPNTVLTTSTGAASWTWIIDEDGMGSNSDTHVPTQQSVKAYVDSAVSGGLTHKGAYDAATNTPALDTGSPTLSVGDMYTVTVAGTFFTEAVEVGDVLISDVDSTDAAQLSDWTIVQRNIDYATESTPGFIQIATTGEVTTGTDNTKAITPTKLENWNGSTNIASVGTIGAGTWQGNAISTTYIQNTSGTNTGDEPNASETVLGIIEIATQAEVDAGASALLAVTPDYLHKTTFDGGTF